MDLAEILISQYRAALAMLRQTLTACPDAMWDAASDPVKFWQLAYHTLFFTHAYVGESEDSLTVWPGRHAGDVGELLVDPVEPYTRAELLDYLDFCEAEVRARVPQLDLAGPPGFGRSYPAKVELQIYSIRHIMQHMGALAERLYGVTEEIRWVGARRG